jgi:nucleotide-binding universal stress UspA family protein
MFSKILVPTDGSETSRKAAKHAIELAKLTGGAVVVLSVIDRSTFFAPAVPGPASPTHLIEPLEDYMRQLAEKDLAEVEKLCAKKGVASTRVLRYGHPVEEIMAEAHKSKVSLIVMGSHGRSALQAALLGSVTFGVIHKDTKVPVLVVRK